MASEIVLVDDLVCPGGLNWCGGERERAPAEEAENARGISQLPWLVEGATLRTLPCTDTTKPVPAVRRQVVLLLHTAAEVFTTHKEH